tara:strand:+ start:80003 stop:80764 length:762 start_codon:yes stop_codon:yes gene_type:complete
MKFHIIIPARYDSARLPGKALLDIAGKSLVERVYERAVQADATSVVIATDDKRIEAAATNFGAKVVMTRADHTSGTDRLAEAVETLQLADDDIIVNVQGDEPMVPVASIQQVAQALHDHADIGMTTLCSALRDKDDLFNRNVVKVVRDKDNNALYFSRATVPWSRDAFIECPDGEHVDLSFYRWHIGIYAYRVSFLKKFVSWPESPLEDLERLEQLRVLWHGEKIHVADAKERSMFDVNTQEDLEKVRDWFDS